MGHVDLHLAELSRTIDPAELGRRIRTARVAAGMTQAQVAAGEITAAYLSRIEDGQRRPEAGLLERMASRMGVSLDDLLLDVTRDKLLELELAVDHAELSLVSGNAAAALDAVDSLLAETALDGLPTLRRSALRIRAGALENVGDLDGAILVLEDLFADPTPDAAWLKGLIALSRCYRDSGDYARAVKVGERASGIIEELELNGLTESIQLTVTVAGAQLFMGDAGQAMRSCMRALAAAEEHGSIPGKAAAYWNASVVESTRGSTASAIEMARKALALFELSDDSRNLARLRSEVANLYLEQDPADPDMALATLANQEMGLSWSGASAWDFAYMHLLRGRAHILRGDRDEARACAEKVNELRPPDSPGLEAHNSVLLGRIAFLEGDQDAARRHFQSGALALTSIGSDRSAAQLWFELADLLASVGDHEGAVQAFRSAGASSGLRPLRNQSFVEQV
jgi:tetratricopeptide (TPR) repeat protein